MTLTLRLGHLALSLSVFGVAACASGGGRAPAAPKMKLVAPPKERPPPVIAAPRRPATTSLFGATVVDDYAWLEDSESAETKAFIDAENALSRSALDALPERAAVRARVASILSAGGADWSSLLYEGGRLFALKSSPPKQQRLLVEIGASVLQPRTASTAPTESVILDPNALDPSGKTTIDFFVPSPDGRTLAVSLSKNGTESGDLHLIDAATGKDRNETIARVNGGTAGGSVAFNADGTGFYYTRYPRAPERSGADQDFFQQVWFHKIGSPESKDTMALGEGLPRIAEIELVRSPDGRRVMAHVANGDGGEVEHHVLDSGKWTRLSRFEDEIVQAAFGPDGAIYAVSRKGAPRGKIVTFAPPYDKPPVDVAPEGDAVVDEVVVAKGVLYAIETELGPSRVRRIPLGVKPEPLAREPSSKKASSKQGKKRDAPAKESPTTISLSERGISAALLPLPPISNVTSVLRVGDDLLVRVESYVEPPRWMLYRASEHRLIETSLAKKAAFDMSDVEVTRATCASKDGTRVPMSVLTKRGAPRDGSMSGLLTGYGGFGVSVRPRMRATFRVWLDHGGVVAEANLRGGGELGEAWHRAGSRTHKQNVFDDFAACAKALFDQRYTQPSRLAITGRSNGGLLMGASLVQHPEMFRAVVASVGIYDMVRTELSPNGAFNITEYGSVKDEAEARALLAYSPFHHVKDDVVYPAVLFTTGANDPRVDPYHSRKMVARLQAATAGGSRPVLLRADASTGHGMGTPLDAEIEETTDALAFLLHEVR